MPLGDLFRRRPPDAENCPACGALLPHNANYCPNCGIRIDEPEAQPLHIVDRATGLFQRALHPARAGGRAAPGASLRPAPRHRADRAPAGQQPQHAEADEESLKMMAAAIAGTLRDVDTPGVLAHSPPSLLAVLPDTDIAGNRPRGEQGAGAVNSALAPAGRRPASGSSASSTASACAPGP